MCPKELSQELLFQSSGSLIYVSFMYQLSFRCFFLKSFGELHTNELSVDNKSV